MSDFSGPRIERCTPPIPVDPLTGAAFPGNRIPANRLSPAGLLYLQLYALPNTTPATGSCNNWVQSLDSPIDWRRENVRFDYTLSNTSRVMVRYTRDSWVNEAPSASKNLWGDDEFPGVSSNWDQPGRSLVAQLSQNLGLKAVNTLQFSYSANRSITVTRGGDNPGLSDRILGSRRCFRTQRVSIRPNGRIRSSGAARAMSRCGTKRRFATIRTCSCSRTSTPTSPTPGGYRRT